VLEMRDSVPQHSVLSTLVPSTLGGAGTGRPDRLEVTDVVGRDAEAIDPPAALMMSTAFLLGRAARVASDLVAGVLAPIGLHARHYAVLMALAEGGPSSQHRLGRWLSIDRTTMVAAVDELERLGLVIRKPDPADRRAYRVELTGRGRGALVRATGAVARAEAALQAALTPDDVAQLRALLARLTPSAEHDQATPPEPEQAPESDTGPGEEETT
jgi:MarR family transcriptional regulator, lower aerobic nicotinate degradation pathway regulator